MKSGYPFLALSLLVVLMSPVANADRLAVCHVPLANPQYSTPVYFRTKPFREHVLHGDKLVGAERCDAIPDNDCDGAPDPVADDADCVAALGTGSMCVSGICEPPGEDTPIGFITDGIYRGGNPPGSDRGVESAAANLVADAQLWATSSYESDVAFENPGGVRSDLTYHESNGEGDGIVTYGEASTFQPFDNTLIILAMTGAEIISALEDQCQPPGATRPFLHLGVSNGFTYDLSWTEGAGDCTAISVSNIMINGVGLNPSTIYLVTVNSFLAIGGDNFDTFETIGQGLDTGIVEVEAVASYLAANSPVAPPPTDRVNEL